VVDCAGPRSRPGGSSACGSPRANTSAYASAPASAPASSLASPPPPAVAHAQECADAASHPAWIFCHDFEAPDAASLDRYWDDVYGAPSRTFLIGDNPAGVPGSHSMRLQVVNDGDAALANGVTSGPSKFLGRDVDWDEIHYRRYMRFDADFHQGNFMHVGGLIACSAALYPWGCLGHAGERPRGDERFTSNLEPWSNYQRLPWPGKWGFYSYYHRMSKDCGHPGPDDCYGDLFAPETDVLISRGAWHVLEMAIDPGTPGLPDGSQTFWVDGRKAFTQSGIAWRTSPALRVNEAGVYLYIHNNPARTTNILDVDNVLFSRGYIGPAVCEEGAAIEAPCVCGGAADPERADNVVVEGVCVGGVWRGAGGAGTMTAEPASTSTGSATSTVAPTAVTTPTATAIARPSTSTASAISRRALFLPWAGRRGGSAAGLSMRALGVVGSSSPSQVSWPAGSPSECR